MVYLGQPATSLLDIPVTLGAMVLPLGRFGWREVKTSQCEFAGDFGHAIVELVRI